MKPLHLLFIILCSAVMISCGNSSDEIHLLEPRQTQAPDFVYLQDNHFMVNNTQWFPLMLNYKVDWRRLNDTVVISPVFYYDNPEAWEATSAQGTLAQMDAHFGEISSWGFNTVRVCIDLVNSDEKGYFYGSSESPIRLKENASQIIEAARTLLSIAKEHQLRVMFLLKAPMDDALMEFTGNLLKGLQNETSLWAYDFMNEPLYFAPESSRSKTAAWKIVNSWREMMNQNAPNQLFTIGFAEPIEVFEWDPSILPVDFVEMHTYHPLRVGAEMYWYGHYVHKPWIVGETALPADNDSVPYSWQVTFLRESYQCAINNGACGYGWWEFQDCPKGVNFEAQFTGVKSLEGEKPVAAVFKELKDYSACKTVKIPSNYYNLLGYENLGLKGKIVDEETLLPVEGAVVRGWNKDWSVGMNTFSNKQGEFLLVSNDYVSHLVISAPGYSRWKTNLISFKHHKQLKNQDLEYHKISYKPFLRSEESMLTFKPMPQPTELVEDSILLVKLSPIVSSK